MTVALTRGPRLPGKGAVSLAPSTPDKPGCPRADFEVFARMLERPVVQEIRAGEFAERAVEDLNKSVHKLSVPGAPSGPPPVEGLQVRPERNGYTIDLNYRGLFLCVMGVLLAGVGSGLAYWHSGPGITGGKGSPWVVPVVAVFSWSSVFSWPYDRVMRV